MQSARVRVDSISLAFGSSVDATQSCAALRINSGDNGRRT
jgi:hypothetical protein